MQYGPGALFISIYIFIYLFLLQLLSAFQQKILHYLVISYTNTLFSRPLWTVKVVLLCFGFDNHKTANLLLAII